MPLKFDDRGLIPAIVQDDASGEILMFAWMNAESLKRTHLFPGIPFLPVLTGLREVRRDF